MSGEPQSGTQRWRLAGSWDATLPHLFVGGDLRSAATIDEYTHRHQGAAGQPATGENIAEVAGEGEHGVYRSWGRLLLKIYQDTMGTWSLHLEFGR